MTTKIHAACADEHTAVALVLSEGQRHDSVPLPAVYTEAAQSGTITRVIADRAYDGGPVRHFLADHHVATTIPSPSNRRIKARWLYRFYRQRHKIENFFRKLFDFRRVATRYDKLARSYLAFVHLCAAIILLRHFVNTP